MTLHSNKVNAELKQRPLVEAAETPVLSTGFHTHTHTHCQNDDVLCHVQVRSRTSVTTQAVAAGSPDLTSSRDTSADTQVSHV